jgi:hypothetical protein
MSETTEEVFIGGAPVFAEEPEKKKTEPRPYTVLRKVQHAQSPAEATSNTWIFVRVVEATTVEQAVTRAVEFLLATTDEKHIKGEFVAIASRSFKPVPVDVDLTPRIKIG